MYSIFILFWVPLFPRHSHNSSIKKIKTEKIQIKNENAVMLLKGKEVVMNFFSLSLSPLAVAL
jgi:hypothetical protein